MSQGTAIVLIADGLTPEALDDAIRAGDVPELSAGARRDSAPS